MQKEKVMKVCLSHTAVYGFPYRIQIPDLTDPTEKVIEISDNKAKKWLDMQKKYDIWQKEIDSFLGKTNFWQ